MREFELCKGRHKTPATESIFPETVNPFDFAGNREIVAQVLKDILPCDYIAVYVTGLTPALVTVINYCLESGINLLLKHFDRESGEYRGQWVTGGISEWLK